MYWVLYALSYVYVLSYVYWAMYALSYVLSYVFIELCIELCMHWAMYLLSYVLSYVCIKLCIYWAMYWVVYYVAGVKQPPIDNLIPDKTYVFFSHTIKAQPENMELLDAVLEKVCAHQSKLPCNGHHV